MEIVVFLLVLALAFVNGANDVPKGVATLVGAGAAKLRTALVWGAVMTVLGSLLSLRFADNMTELFSKGIVSTRPTAAFAVAVLLGTVAWVALATVRKLPVSTTHALVGALLGAGAVFAPSAVEWSALIVKVVQPLLLTIAVAYGMSLALTYLVRFLDAKLSVGKLAARGGSDEGDADEGDAPVAESDGARVRTATAVRPEAPSGPGAVGVAHWLTSGLASLARGLNDTPKIVAVGSFALLSGMTPGTLAVQVAVAMAAGGLLAGPLVARRMAHDVLTMSHTEGLTANLTTATLVSLGAFQGLPMSTTHVSTSAIAATASSNLSRLKGKTLRDFALAWLVTPPFAATVAAGSYLLIG